MGYQKKGNSVNKIKTTARAFSLAKTITALIVAADHHSQARTPGTATAVDKAISAARKYIDPRTCHALLSAAAKKRRITTTL